MTRGVPMIHPKVHLKGATPEKLARALLRNPLRPRPGIKPVAGREVSKQEVPPDHAGNGVAHLVKSA